MNVTVTGPAGQSRTTVSRTADATGTVQGTFTIPPIAPVGTYRFVLNATLTGQTSHLTLEATVTR